MRFSMSTTHRLVSGLTALIIAAACAGDPPTPPPPPDPEPAIGLSTASVTVSDTTFTTAPSPITITITNAGTGTLEQLALGPVSYGAGATGWLTASISGTTAPATITLSFANDSLAEGTWTASIPVIATGAVNTPQTITISYDVTMHPPEFLLAGGDIASCSHDIDEATAKLLDVLPGTVAPLGDNVYTNGTAEEYANCYAPTWGRHKARTMPAPGNHDYNTPGAAGYYGYFGAAAGDPAKGYYSYDLGQWHIVVLNSNIDAKQGSAQLAWLRQDLAAAPNRCTLAYWHHPRFTSGTRQGDTGRMVDVVQELYDRGVEVALVGHDHLYERFTPQTPQGVADGPRGTRHFTVGMAGSDARTAYQFGTILATSEVRQNTAAGILKLALWPDRYEWEYVPVAGATFTDTGSTSCH